MPETPDALKTEDGRPPLKIAICLPTHDMVPAGFMYDLANLAGFTGVTLMADDIADISLLMVQATIVQAGREDLAQRALMADATHLLWVDTDMRFPKDALIRLLNHNKPIVGINYSTRSVPPKYVAYSGLEQNPDGSWGQRLVTEPGAEGLQEAAAVGFGLVLIQSRVFWDIAEKCGKPFFDFTHIGQGAAWKGEDIYFCEKAAECGYEVFVDADLSQRCAHIGQFEYRLDHAAAVSEAEELKEHGARILQ